MKSSQAKKIIIYDNRCGICNFWVNFIKKNDRRNQFIFLGSDTLEAKAINVENIDSIIFIDDHTLKIKSKAIFKIAQLIGFPFNMIGFLKILPISFTDALYDRVAKNRYRWSKQGNSCKIPISQNLQ